MQISKIFLFLFIAFLSQAGQRAKGQIRPDNTLGAESSTINRIDEFRSLIEGGATRGSNLFHSFSDFNISKGLKVYFANPKGIGNIFSRVTGNNISEILGTLGVDGNANLFFLNPKGIVFGENAFVDVGGAFIATTASTIEFLDGTSFNSREDNQKPLLTWNAPIGLGLDNNSGKIVVRGIGHNLLLSPQSVPVPDNNIPSSRTQIFTPDGFALLGNGIEFSGGVLDISAEKFELGSINQGQVKFFLSPQLEFDYSQVEKFADISLDNFSLIDINGDDSIEANLQGSSIKLQDGSSIIQSVTVLNPQQNNRININSSEQLLIRGITESRPPSPGGLSRGISLIAFQNINVQAKDFILESGGQIGNLLLENYSGSLKIDATESLHLDGFIPSNSLLGFSGIGSVYIGNGGTNSIDIATKNLSITNGAGIFSIAIDSARISTINIKAENSILIDGTSNDSNLVSPSIISTSNVSSSGISGDIRLNTKDLSVLNGGVISTSSFSDATAGEIIINAKDSIIIDGEAEGEILDGQNSFSAITSLVSRINPDLADASPAIPDDPVPTGDAGGISLKTNNLTISDRGSVTVQNEGLGNGGEIKINANSINLENFGSINAAAASGIGGNIEINTSELNLDNNSQITAVAGGDQLRWQASPDRAGGNITITADNSVALIDRSSISASSSSGQGGVITIKTDEFQARNSNISTSAEGLGNGGNISINSDTALFIGDSDVTATAVQGDGGNILIDADAVLGIEERRAIAENGRSDADASSEFGEDGTVEIKNPLTSEDDPIVAAKEPEIRAIEPSFAPRCVKDSDILEDKRHENIPPSPYRVFGAEEYAPDPDFVPPPADPKPSSLEDLMWKKGDPVASGDKLIATPDGKLLLVVGSQLESLRRRGCLSEEILEIDE